MNREQWVRLKPLFHGALEQPPDARAEWLRRACAGDDPLAAEVQALIDAHDRAGAFLEAPPSFDPSLFAPPDRIEEGRRIGPYVIRGELGRGGMGIVYLAEDVRLARTVALKALPSSLAGDAQRRERLRREARAAAALSHPGIAVVYALEEVDGELFIAAEHLRGRTLKAELAQGPLGPARALDTAAEIVAALAAAHDGGIVHRDLKPENVLRTGDGRIKILDFGIAHFTDRTLTQLTVGGALLGTPAYMAPEQLAGAEVDFRADIYAVGVLLLEMATGAHPFGTSPDREAPPAAESVRGSAAGDAVLAIAERCLARNPRDRYGSARELLAALETARRQAGADREALQGAADTGRFAAPSKAATYSPHWWWEFHQAVAALIYWMMAIPLWTARGLIGGAAGRVLFMLALAGIIVAANVRLHRWFTSRFYPRELPWVRGRTARWVAAGDVVFALSLVAAGLMVGDAGPELATLLLAVGIGAAVAFLVIEPVTERAAFHS